VNGEITKPFAVPIDAYLSDVDVPICDVCGKPVLIFTRDNCNCEPGGVNFTAVCHGQEERVHVSDEDMRQMMAAGQTRFVFGKAFLKKPKALPEGQP
jgi:hypothetical protein